MNTGAEKERDKRGWGGGRQRAGLFCVFVVVVFSGDDFSMTGCDEVSCSETLQGRYRLIYDKIET